MSALLDGKIALVTGASKGIGAAAARLFAAEGATVVLTARDEAALRVVTAEIVTAGGRASYVVADLGERTEIDRTVHEVIARHGRLDAAFNNAGVLVPPAGLADTSPEHFDLVNRVNYRSVYFAVAAQVRSMRATGGGAIVNNTSVASLAGDPHNPAYAASKRAVNSLTASAAVGYAAAGIRVNAIATGLTLTEMTAGWERADPGVLDRITAGIPLGRAARPEEIAQAAAWLLSDRASFVTGTVLPVTGGAGLALV